MKEIAIVSNFYNYEIAKAFTFVKMTSLRS
jgi:hypothetical protein